MLPVLSALTLLFSTNLTEIVSDGLRLDPTLHTFADMAIGVEDRDGSALQDGFVAMGDRWEPPFGGAVLSWNGFQFLAKWQEMSVSMDGRDGAAKRLWIDGRCKDKELILPSDSIRWKDARLQGDIRFLAPPGCEIVMDLADSVAGMGVRLSMDSVSFDASGRARLGTDARLSWMAPRQWGRFVEKEWRDTLLGSVILGAGTRLPDTVRFRQDLRGEGILSKEMLVTGGKLHAIGFRGWSGFEIAEVDRIEIDRDGAPVDVPMGRLQSIRITDQLFLTWKGSVAVRRGSLLVGKARDFRLVEIVWDRGFSAGPLDRIGRRKYTSDTIEMVLVGDTLVAKRPSLRRLFGGWVAKSRYEVPLRRDGSDEFGWIKETNMAGGIPGLTDSSGQFVVFPQLENDRAPGMVPRRKLVLHLDAGIKISYRIGRSGKFREATEARVDLGEWGNAGMEVEYGYDPEATSVSGDRTPLGYVVFNADRQPPLADFAFPWLERWGRFLPGKRIRQTGENDKIVCEGKFVPNDAWRKSTGKDTLVAFATLPVVRDPQDRMKILRTGEGVVKVVLPRKFFPQEGVLPIGAGSPQSLRLDSRGEAWVGAVWNEWYVEEATSSDFRGQGGFWKWARPLGGSDSTLHRAIYRGGSFQVGIDAKPIAWKVLWREFAGRDSLQPTDGSILRACRKIGLSWVETEKGISKWTARAPGLVRRARGESRWTVPKGDEDLEWQDGKGFSNLFDENSGKVAICLEKRTPLEQPAVLDGIAVDRTPATVGEWDACVRTKGCSVYRSPFDSTKTDQAYAAEVSKWQEVRAEGMTFAQAKAFCRSRSARLPTQQEWENVVSTHCYPFDHPEFCAGSSHEGPQPVAQGKAYSNGIHDLAGREGVVWCSEGLPCLKQIPESLGTLPTERSKPFGPVGVRCVRDLDRDSSEPRGAP